MRKKKLTALLALVLCSLIVLTGCSSKPTAKDAQQYVQAVMDAICTGDYDHSLKFVDMDAGSLDGLREEAIDGVMSELTDDMGLSEETTGNFKEAILKAFEKSKYTVGDAAKRDDGSFDVTVTIEPLNIFDGVSEKMEEAAADLMSDPEAVADMSYEDMMDQLLNIMADTMKENLDTPTYAEPVDVTVNYKELEDGVYGVDEADGQAIGEKLFNTEGME